LPPAHDVTALLRAWREGDDGALHALVPLVHDELHRVARRCVQGDRGHQSIQATLLVNEAFLRLVDVRQVDWQSRAHFLAMSARVMRRVLVDYARARTADKRGGGAIFVSFDENAFASTPAADVVRLHDALEALAALDARKSRVVELRFFGGLTVDETAAVLEVSPKTVLRDWEFARAWLQRELTRETGRDA
jgi:RNA polymerase sigma factor (TIGR02999 family)